jgi:hypothetical protein
MSSEDVRDRASSWLERELPQSGLLAVPREPFFHSPALVHAQYFYNRPDSPLQLPDRLRVTNLEWQRARLERSSIPLVLLSEYELSYPAAESGPNVALLTTLYDDARWRELARFENRPMVLGRPLEPPMPGPGWAYTLAAARELSRRAPPHDFKYLNPTVLVLTRAPAAGSRPVTP